MVETRSTKRRRLMSISSNVSSWPNVPARFESLNDDTLTTVLEFVGNKSYRSFGGMNKQCKEVYLNTPGMTKETFLYGYAPLSAIIDRYKIDDWDLLVAVGKGVVFYNRRDILSWAFKRQDEYLLKAICSIAAEEGRIDLLNEVWNNMNDDDDKRFVFRGVGCYAAGRGKLIVLKWADVKEFDIDKEECAKSAARHAQLHIIQWLKEEQDLQLFGRLYYEAIYGGQLHVIRWLKEQEVPWDVRAFIYAVVIGNLDILQWVHDEGCPWPENSAGDGILLDEDRLKPEVVQWLRVNGYGDRIW